MLFTKESECSVSVSNAFKVFELLSIILLRHIPASCGLIYHPPKPHYDFISQFSDPLYVSITKYDCLLISFCMLTAITHVSNMQSVQPATGIKSLIWSPTILILIVWQRKTCTVSRLVLAFHPSIHPCPKPLRRTLGAHTLLILRQLLNFLLVVPLTSSVPTISVPYQAFKFTMIKRDRKPVISNGSLWHVKTSATVLHCDRTKANEVTRESLETKKPNMNSTFLHTYMNIHIILNLCTKRTTAYLCFLHAVIIYCNLSIY